MADIRIKDLTTTASSTASDDFIAVDGATNGTRKLNAYSPTFGGNATVNGAATFNATAIISSAGIANAHLTINNTFGKEVRLYSGIIGTNNNGFSVRNETNTTDWLTIDGSGNVKVPATTASTSTSTGALVVSGGIGVGGSLNAGAVHAANSITGGDLGGGTSIIQFKDGSGSTKINFKGNGEVTLSATTASTSTSTGALVVGNGTSGGLGVGGAINAGGTIRVVGSSHTTRFRQDDAIIDFNNTAENAYVTGTITGNTLQLKGNNGTGLTIGTTGNATFAGNITTAAPAGGTAAAWKLGTVATVSPTSPNRTIEVDIGGTIYYIHAKTTNN